MSDIETDLKTKLREAESKVTAVQDSLKEAKATRTQWAITSAVAGFLLFAVGGQWVPGYQLDSTAEKNATAATADAVGVVMAELCAERFMRAPGLQSRLVDLNEFTGDWAKATFIRDGTWATSPAGEQADHSTAEKCRSLIAQRVSAETEKTS